MVCRSALSVHRRRCPAPGPLDGAAHSRLPSPRGGASQSPCGLVPRPVLLLIVLYQSFTFLILRGVLSSSLQYWQRSTTSVLQAPSPGLFVSPALLARGCVRPGPPARLVCSRPADSSAQVPGVASLCRVTAGGLPSLERKHPQCV